MRHIGFETDAFNRMFPASYQKNVVFSPMSFELDCAVIAECLDTIPKAKISEQLGVVLDFESSYRPMLDFFACRTNGNLVVSARGFCVPEVHKAVPAHRLFLERVYDVEVMRVAPAAGAECWFRASMEGEMEDFALPGNSAAGKYAFYDLISFSAAWRDSFPVANTRPMRFETADGGAADLEFMSDVREVEAWETKEFTMLVLPLKDEAWFYAIMPNPGQDLTSARRAVSSTQIEQLLTVTKSLTEEGVFRGVAEVALPKMELRSRLNMVSAFGYFGIPLQGLNPIAGEATPSECVQWTRFRLSERGRGGDIAEGKSSEERALVGPAAKRFVFSRPFLFFIYHVPSATVPMAGQFTGRE